jgi:diguanylate cyclase (GGDEF)-like protein
MVVSHRFALHRSSMAKADENLDTGTSEKPILVIGDGQAVFLDADGIDARQVEVCADVSDAVQSAGTRQWALIAVEVRGQAGRLATVLKDLKETSRAKVILLARIWEEPIAMRWTAGSEQGVRADDYLICPTTQQRLLAYASAGRRPASRDAGGTALAESEARIRVLERLATEDDLTGLKNRRYLWEFAQQILEYARSRNAQMTLFLYDIDDFKHYNDTYGHAAGDTILREIGVLMTRCCRSHDVVGRLGGDEFAVVFWDDRGTCTPASPSERRRAKAGHPTEAMFIAQRFREALERFEWRFLGSRGKGVLTISGGLASFPQDGNTVDELFQKADTALLEAKRSGKNRVTVVGSPASKTGG